MDKLNLNNPDVWPGPGQPAQLLDSHLSMELFYHLDDDGDDGDDSGGDDRQAATNKVSKMCRSCGSGLIGLIIKDTNYSN